MKRTTLLFYTLILVAALCVNYNKTFSNSRTSAAIPKMFPAPAAVSSSSINIVWSPKARKISHQVYNAGYGRIQRLDSHTLLLTYHCGGIRDPTGNIALRKSEDNGLTWGNARILMTSGTPGYYGFSNPQALVMKNGWIMLAFAGKGKPDDNLHDNLQIRISKDHGESWSTPQVVTSGRSWEPGMVQLPDGDIELFYSSEAKWWPGHQVQQDILMIHSTDNGTSWTAPAEVGFSPGKRDGMPVPLLLKDNKGIVCSIESVRNTKSPFIIWSSTAAKWNDAERGTVQNKRRWVAISDSYFGGAPYLVQLPTGETLLSFQAKAGRNVKNVKKNTMLVYAGNDEAKNFRRMNDPWPNLPENEGAYYSSLFVKDANTVVLVTTRNNAKNISEVWWKEGKIMR